MSGPLLDTAAAIIKSLRYHECENLDPAYKDAALTWLEAYDRHREGMEKVRAIIERERAKR
jgi:hypothetical protein